MVQTVRLARIARGLKGYELAAMLRYNPQLWLEVEKGLRVPPKEVAQRASDILDIPVAQLFTSAEEGLGIQPLNRH